MWNWNSFAKTLATTALSLGLLLGQDTSKAKVKALEGLAKQGKNAVPSIAPYQVDADPQVRYASVEALIDAGGVESVDAMRLSCQDGAAEVQRLAVAGIVNFYKPGYVKKGIRARITTVSDKITRNISEPVIDPFVVARTEDVEAIRGVLNKGANRDAKLQAAEALATLRAKSALPDLYPLLQSKDDGLMMAALRAVEVAGDKKAASETIFLLRDLNDKIQARAISINGVFRNEAALPDLAEVFARGRNPKSRAAALEAIAMIGSTESRGLFEQNLEQKDGKLRGFAAEGLGRIHAAEHKAKIEELYKAETSVRARLGQAFALVSLGQLETGEFSPVTYLFNQLNSAAWHEFAESYLVELSRNGDEVRKILREKAPAGTRAEKIGVARVLGREGKADDRAAVDALAHDRDAQVADEGIKAARALGARLP